MLNLKFFQDLPKGKLLGYFFTIGVEFIIMLIGVGIFKLISEEYSAEGFAEYNINKRIQSFLIPLIMVGLGVSLPKCLPTVDEKNQKEIHYTGLITTTCIFVLVCMMSFLVSEFCSTKLFGDKNHETTLFSILLYVYALIVHACTYNYFRGKLNFLLSSSLQLFNLGIIPFFVVFISDSIAEYLMIAGLLTLFFLLFINLFHIKLIRFSFAVFKVHLTNLFRYGIQRMPGDVILGLLLSSPAFIISSNFSLITAGVVAFNISLFNIVIAIMSPLNIIVLPEASKIVFERDYVLLKKISDKLLAFSIVVSLVIFFVVFTFGEEILMVFNIKDSSTNKYYLYLIFSGILGYGIFSIVRSIIDAFYNKAIVTVIISAAFAIFLICFYITKFFYSTTIENILISFSISVNTLGLLTYYFLVKISHQTRLTK